MNRVYCDVCGTAYSEKDTHCPNCGCARPAQGGVSDDHGQDNGSYTYVKGGRFSKSNVRKRNQGKPNDDLTISQDPKRDSLPDDGERTDKGLVVAVCVLLLAIVAVVLYIVTRFFTQGSIDDTGNMQQYLEPSTDTSTASTLIPETTELLEKPTTESIAPTIEETVLETEAETIPNQNYYVEPYELSTEKRKNDVTIYRKGTFELELRDATGELMDIKWEVEDPSICSVVGNTVTGLNVGKTTVYVTLNGTTYSCIVRVKG